MVEEGDFRDEFIEFVLSSSEFRDVGTVAQQFIRTFIDAIMHKSDFEISVSDFCVWLGKNPKRPDNITRYLKEFKKGIDFDVKPATNSVPGKEQKMETYRRLY